MINQELYQALYDAVVRQSYLFNAMASEFINSTPNPMYGVAAWLQREADERWEISERVKKIMVKYGSAPLAPAIPTVSPQKPEEAMQVIMAGEAVALNAARALLAAGCKHAVKIYYDHVGKQYDETHGFFVMFPAQDGDALVRFDRQMWNRYTAE